MTNWAGQDPATLTAAFNARVDTAGIKALRPITEATATAWVRAAVAWVGRRATEPPPA